MTSSSQAAPKPLVSVEWLKSKLTSPSVRILDATIHMDTREAAAEFKEKHIPGACFFDINECADLKGGYDVPHMLPEPALFEEYVAARGINNSCHVVIYDNNKMFPVFSAQRLWWTFRAMGYDNVSILEGGLNKWIAAGGEVTNEETKPKKETFKTSPRPKLVKSYDDVIANLKSGEFQLVDARPPGRFNGTGPEPIPGVKSGHIPTAINVPFPKLMDTENKTYRTKEELAKVFKDSNIDLSKPIIFTCGSGLQASNLVLASYICGKEDAGLYDGSWTEWFRRAPDNLKENLQE